MLNIKNFFLLFFLLINISFADRYSSELAIGFGMNNIKFKETESVVLDSTRSAEPLEDSASIVTADIRYKLFPSNKLDYFVRFTGPVLADGANSYFGVHLGANYYFLNSGSKVKYNDEGNTVSFTPKLRAFAGLEIGTEYLIYAVPKESKENDLILDIGAHLGASYNIFKNWSIMPSAHFARGVGAKTTTTNMQFGLNFVYFFKGFGRSNL